MNIRIGNDICLYVNLLGNKNLDAMNINSINAFLINTSKWKDLMDEQYRESALMADEIECRKDKVKYISRFPVEPAFPGFHPTPYDVCCTGRPGYHCDPFPYVPAYHGYGVRPHTFEPLCQWRCDDMHDIYERAGYKHMDMQRQYDRCRFLAPVEATESKNKVKIYFPAQAQLYTGTYKLVIVAKVYEPGYCKNNLRNITIDYDNVFTLVNSSDQGCDCNITIDVNCDCNCNACCCQQEKPEHKCCFDALLEQLNALKAKVDKYHPDTPEPTLDGYALFTTKPSLETIINSVDTTAAKPANGKELDMSSLSRPTMCYFVYPLSWEIIENGLLIIPAIFDSNGFETGATIDAETPTVDVNGVTYRILDVRLGKGKYRVNFNR